MNIIHSCKDLMHLLEEEECWKSFDLKTVSNVLVFTGINFGKNACWVLLSQDLCSCIELRLKLLTVSTISIRQRD